MSLRNAEASYTKEVVKCRECEESTTEEKLVLNFGQCPNCDMKVDLSP